MKVNAVGWGKFEKKNKNFKDSLLLFGTDNCLIKQKTERKQLADTFFLFYKNAMPFFI